ncbi:MAG: putative manganese-dependent inorganic diphosphatase [Thermomicrobiales bacterium]
MTETVWVVGHQNPDTDSICSAIAYAALRRLTDLPGATPARLGPLWAETSAALARCGVESPPLLTDVRQRVGDVMNPAVVTIGQDATLYEAGRIMRDERKRLLPVVDERRRLCGLLTVDDIAGRYLDDMAVEPAHRVPISLAHYLRILGGTLLVGSPDRHFAGRIWLGTVQVPTIAELTAPGDLVIVGDRENAQEAALRAGADCLIVVGGQAVSQAVLMLAAERGATVIGSPHDTYATARLLNLSLPVAEFMREPGATAAPDDLVTDLAATLVGPGAPILPVVDDEGVVLGIVSRGDLLRGRRKRVILVDHNHRSQAVEGLEEAELLGVIDHHNLGDLHTAAPIRFVLEPVGCTATIIIEHYVLAGLMPEPSIAGLLLAAIISDTLLFTSPTTTERDRIAARILGEGSGLEVEAFAHELFAARSDFSATTPRELVANNLKTYTFGGASLAIGQAEALSTGYFMEHKAEFVGELGRLKAEGGYDHALFLVTDILHSNSTMLYPGEAERRLVQRAFDPGQIGADSAELPGVVSRKQQVIPPLARALDRR